MLSRKNKRNNARIQPEKNAKEKETILMTTVHKGKSYLQKKK